MPTVDDSHSNPPLTASLGRAADTVIEPSTRVATGQEMADRLDKGTATRDEQRTRCERCGAPVRVHILEGYVEGKPVRRHLCSDCADTAYALYLKHGAGHVRPRLSLGSLLITGGLLLVVLGISVDQFGIQGSAGFGWKQQAGLLAGLFVVIVGSLLRIDVVAIAGAILVAIAALADVSGLIGAPGVGWRQQAVILAGLVFIWGGIFLRKRQVAAPRERTGDALDV